MIAPSGKQLLGLLFNEGESVCVSHDGYGYHSVPLENLDYAVLELDNPNKEIGDKTIRSEEIRLVALNPVKGYRRDENVTCFRSFLVEMDEGPLPDQLRYIREMNMPYSACVFSGSKSLHFAITLSSDLPNYETYYYYATWILNVMSKADPNTKNPTRSIRLAGAIRETGREQQLVELKERIGLDTLNAWLSQYQGFKPTGFFTKKKEGDAKTLGTHRRIPRWVLKELKNGLKINKGRNRRWFQIASEFGKAGYDEEETVDFLDNYFTPEYDFKRPEWVTTVKSGVRNGQKKG
jgi:hypothetical protein